MFRCYFFLAYLALYLQVSFALKGPKLTQLKHILHDEFKSDSLAGSSSSSSSANSQPLAPNYIGPVTHIPLKARYHVNLDNPKHVERNGLKLMTIDAPLIGCPMMDFSAPVNIGTQGPFELIVDTGSTSLGVAATTCGTNCAVSLEYNPATSSTSLGATFSSTFGDGTGWSGAAVSDSVSVDGSTATTIKFAAISTQNGFFRSSSCAHPNVGPPPNDGIIGFAFAGLGVQGKNGNNIVSGVKAEAWFIKNAAATGNPAVFALRLCQGAGDLYLNGYDTNSFTDQIHWTKVAIFDYVYNIVYPLAAGNDFWTVAVHSIGPLGGTVDSTLTDFQGNNSTFGVNTIVDSGTTLAIVPPAAFNDLISAIPSTTFQSWFGVTPASFFSTYTCSASTASSATMNAALPKSVVTIGNSASGTPVSITLNGINFLLQQISVTGTTQYCSGVISNAATYAQNTNADVILGWSFMNQMIVVHDTTNARIGFAPRTASGCADGSAGAVSISGGDTAIVDPTGGTGQSTVTTTTTTTTAAPTTAAAATTTTTRATTTITTVTTTKAASIAATTAATTAAATTVAATTAAATTTAKGATTAAATTVTTTALKIPSNPCATWGCPSTNTNCAASTTGPAGVVAAQCVVAYVKVAVKVNLANGVVSALTSAETLFTALMNFVQMNGNVAVNLDANGISLKGTNLTFTLDITSSTGTTTTTAAAQSMLQQVTSNAFASSGLSVTDVSACMLDANGNCVTTNAATTDNGGSSSSMSMYIIIAAAAGGAVVLLSIIVAVICYRRRNSGKTFQGQTSNIQKDTRAQASSGPAPPPYTARYAPAPPAAQQAWANTYNNGGEGQTNAWNNRS